MKNLIKALFILIITISLGSCKKQVMGSDTINDPENNFEILWNDFNEHYGLFAARGWDWDAVYSEYRPQVNSNTTDTELWDILSNTIETLDDSHTFLINRESEDQVFVSGFTENQKAKDVWNLEMIAENYLENFKVLVETSIPYLSAGKVINKDIGYIHFKGFGDFSLDLFDQIMDDMKANKAIILDIRNNQGGSQEDAKYVAGLFSDEEHKVGYVRNKIGPGPNEFSEFVEIVNAPTSGVPYLKPVIILSDRASISAAEDFLLYMKPFAHVTQIGDTTAGDFSNTSMVRKLPNGWEYGYSTQEYRNVNMEVIDGIGHIPDIFSVTTPSAFALGEDLVIERATQYLFEEYGIQ